MRKRITGIIVAVSMLFTPMSYPVYGADMPETTGEMEENLQTGLLPIEEVILEGDSSIEYYDAAVGDILSEEESECSTENVFSVESNYFMDSSADSSYDWSKYTNYYVYNQMTEDERDFWDALDALCLSYLTDTVDAEQSTSSGTTYYYLSGGVTSSSLTYAEMKQVYYIFKYHNPQYYFIGASVITMSKGGKYYICPGIYPAFVDGSDRAEYTEAFLAQVNEWEEQIAECSTDAEKVLLIHDLIVNKVDYNYAIYDSDFDEDTQYSQSAYSVFCMDETVCAGYSQAFELLCNSAGVDSIAVTSSSHEWNKVRIDDSWYNVDCTWDDQDEIIYNYFERNDNYFDTESTKSATSHEEESYWEDYLPLCTLDADLTGTYCTSPGTLPTITQTTASPVITVSWQEEAAEISLTCDTDGADLYYSVDGVEPSPGSVKCYKYSEAFAAEENTVVYAVAVCDTCWDSDVVYCTVFDEQGDTDDTEEASETSEATEETSETTGETENASETVSGTEETGGTSEATEEASETTGETENASETVSGTEEASETSEATEETSETSMDTETTSSEITVDTEASEEEETTEAVNSEAENTEVASTEQTESSEQETSEMIDSESEDTETISTEPESTQTPASETTDSEDASDVSDETAEPDDADEDDDNDDADEDDMAPIGTELTYKGLKYVVTDNEYGEVQLVKSSMSGKVTVPDDIEVNDYLYDVTSVASDAFAGNTKITQVKLNSYITEISAKMFSGCTKLTKVTMGDEVTAIGANAFADCTALKTITLPDTLKSIGASAFANCTALKSVTIPTKVTAIGAGAFANCTALTKITIPNKVTAIAANTFSGCKKLKNVKIGSKVKSIGKNAFSGCVALTKISIPNKVETIGDRAFSGCTKLKTVTIGTGLKKIGKEAFKGCAKLSLISISSTKLQSVGKNAFSGIKATAEIKVPSKKWKAYQVLFKNKGLGSKNKIVK